MKIENFEETIMENKNDANISDNAVPVDHTEMPVDETITQPLPPVEMPVPPVEMPGRPSDSSAIRSDYPAKRGSAGAVVHRSPQSLREQGQNKAARTDAALPPEGRSLGAAARLTRATRASPRGVGRTVTSQTTCECFRHRSPS